MTDDVSSFEAHRPALLALAYRMLGEVARAEDAVQDAWVRWQNRDAEVDAPKAFLLKTVTRLCLDELGSARARHEESRSDRLPEPIDLERTGIDRVETLDRVSMAFVVLLQRLTPSERAVFLLHDVFDMSHGEIADLLGKSEAACRQLLSRAKENVAQERRVLQTSREEHRALLLAFIRAINGEAPGELADILAEDAIMIVDPGPGGRRQWGDIREVGQPIVGRRKIVAMVGAIARQEVSPRPELQERVLNGQPAVVFFVGDRPLLAVLVSVAEGRIRHVFMQSDFERLRHLRPLDG